MLSLLDILFPVATMNLVKKLSPMKTIQPSINLWDRKEKYNGWADWTTWNCALWINNDMGYYGIAQEVETFGEFLLWVLPENGEGKTSDGAIWQEADLTEMTELIQEIKA